MRASITFPQWALMIPSVAKLKRQLMAMESDGVQIKACAVMSRVACVKMTLTCLLDSSEVSRAKSVKQLVHEFGFFERALRERCISYDAEHTDATGIAQHRVNQDLVSRFAGSVRSRIECEFEDFPSGALAVAAALLSDDEKTSSEDVLALDALISGLDGPSSSLVLVAACRRGRARQSLRMLRDCGWTPTENDVAAAIEWMHDYAPPQAALSQLLSFRSELACSELLERMGVVPKFIV